MILKEDVGKKATQVYGKKSGLGKGGYNQKHMILSVEYGILVYYDSVASATEVGFVKVQEEETRESCALHAHDRQSSSRLQEQRLQARHQRARPHVCAQVRLCRFEEPMGDQHHTV